MKTLRGRVGFVLFLGLRAIPRAECRGEKCHGRREPMKIKESLSTKFQKPR